MLDRIFARVLKPKLRCVVVTPIGPGHLQTYSECERSVKMAWRANHGPFSALDILPIDDTAGALGRSLARNQGVHKAAAAGADWIFFLDADDLMLPDAFANVTGLVEQYDGVWGLITSGAIGEPEHHLRLPQILRINDIASLLVFDPFLTLQMGHFVRTEAALATPFEINMNAGEDFDYYLRLWQRFRCAKVPRSFFVARQGQRSEGPRSASAEAWGEAVRSRLAQERAQRGLDAESPETLAIKNAGVGELQSFYCEQGLASAKNYFALSREMPYRGLHQIEIFPGKPFQMYSDNDDLVCLSLAWTGEYEYASSRLWLALASRARVILDVGAYTGFYGLLAARAATADARIYCFEPLADNCARLQVNIDANGITNIIALHAAAGGESGEVEINVFAPKGFLTSGASVFHRGQRVTRTERATVVRLDDFVGERGGRVDLVKIDVEGAELMVLSGMTSVISREHPDLLIEVLPDAPVQEIDQLLAASGYRFFAIDEDACRLTPLPRLVACADQAGRNCWATVRTGTDLSIVVEESGNTLRSI